MSVFQVFIDESGVDGNSKVLVLGGVITRQEIAGRLLGGIDSWRARNGIHDEIKWQKIDAYRVDRYQDFATRTLRQARKRTMTIRTLVIDRKRVDHRKFSNGDHEVGFYKFVYQFVLHCFVPCLAPDDSLEVFLDNRTTRYRLPELRRILNCGIRRKYGYQRNMVSRVEPRESKSCDLTQMADLFAGAVRHVNDQTTIEGSKRGLAKDAVASHVVQQIGLPLTGNTPRSMHYFGTWHMQLQA